jgi:hypothetical protein
MLESINCSHQIFDHFDHNYFLNFNLYFNFYLKFIYFTFNYLFELDSTHSKILDFNQMNYRRHTPHYLLISH